MIILEGWLKVKLISLGKERVVSFEQIFPFTKEWFAPSLVECVASGSGWDDS